MTFVGLGTPRAITPTVRLTAVDVTCESPLVAIRLPPPEAAEAVRRAWGEGAAVVVLDPRAPKRRLASAVEAFRPTHLADAEGVREVSVGRPVPRDVAAVVTTSGTTAEPRHVVLTRQAMEASARAVAGAMGIVPDEDHWLACVPLHHVAGLAIVARSWFCQTPMTVHPSFDVNAVSAATAQTTLVSVVPTMLTRLLDAEAPLHRFRRVLLGGSPIPLSLLERALDAGVRVTTTYGLSETGGGCVHDGSPLRGVEVSTSPEGEILVRGTVVMRGYLHDETASRRAFTTDGWLRTGDLGQVDADGIVSVTDRMKDIIVTGGVNVSPTAVECVIHAHPAVADACVTGVADEQWGERVVAFVVPRPDITPPTLEELRSFSSERLSAPELPRELRIVPSVPRSPSGKLVRRLVQRAEGRGR
jgi:o-succinylbenzoate---CoA ligase